MPDVTAAMRSVRTEFALKTCPMSVPPGLSPILPYAARPPPGAFIPLVRWSFASYRVASSLLGGGINLESNRLSSFPASGPVGGVVTATITFSELTSTNVGS
jgi:hypothetical protein